MELNLLMLNLLMQNCNREFLEKDCSSAEIATCLGVLSYCRPKKAPLSSSLYTVTPGEQVW